MRGEGHHRRGPLSSKRTKEHSMSKMKPSEAFQDYCEASFDKCGAWQGDSPLCNDCRDKWYDRNTILKRKGGKK